MPTEKDAAEAERIIGDYYNERNMPKTAKVHYELADAFDPPKLEWANGTVAWVTNINDRRYISVRHANAWRVTDGFDGDHGPVTTDDQIVTKVEPLRVLADDEIAVKRHGGIPLRGAERTVRDAGYGASAKWLENVIDALQAEAGDAK